MSTHYFSPVGFGIIVLCRLSACVMLKRMIKCVFLFLIKLHEKYNLYQFVLPTVNF